LQLVAQAKQFSTFMVLLGKMSSGSEGSFETQYAFMVQNRAEVVVPLELMALPSAKEFREAHSFASLDQQKLAEARRAKQLQDTVFAICVIQVKAHLEQVLHLPEEALLKEIFLTQSLLDQFVNHHVPPDHLCVSGGEMGDPVHAVKGHVAAVYEAINASASAKVVIIP
jgi:hypothetical protein